MTTKKRENKNNKLINDSVSSKDMPKVASNEKKTGEVPNVTPGSEFLGVGKKFRLPMQSCLFFSQPFMKISQKLSIGFP